MPHNLIADLAVVMVVAASTGVVMRRLGQPNVLGYLLAGLIVGPYIPIPLFADPHRMEELSEVGVVLVMFAVGLEFRVRRLLEILPQSGLTALVQIAGLFWSGFTVASWLGWSTAACITLGSTLAISSTMVVSSVLRARPVDADVRAHVFGILVVQDVVAIVLIAIVTALAAGQSLGAQSLGMLMAQLAATVAVMLVVGLLVLPRVVRSVLAVGDEEALVVVVAAASFGFALAADAFGYSVALGAFLAGMAVAESGRGYEVEKLIEPLRAFFSALFFVSIGMTVDPRVATTTLPLALLLCGVVITMQFVSVTVASLVSGSSLRRSVFSGLALGQIGELSFILCTIAVGGGIVPEQTLPALVTVATVTAFTTPLLLGRAESIVTTLDRWLPDSAHDLLVAYQAFVRRMRSTDGGPSLRQRVNAVALDWAALVLLFVVRRSVAPHVDAAWLLGLNVATVLVALPFLVGLVRSGARLATVVRGIVRGGSAPASMSRAVEGLALLAVVLAVGVPTVTVLRPFLTGSWLELALGVALVAVGGLLAVRMSGMEGQYTSGVARLATGLGRHVDDPTPQVAGVDAGLLAGVDYVPVEVPRGGVATGQTLMQLNLRCRTGATVVAIVRGGNTLVLPTGHEPIEADDVLALSGSGDAVARARELLTQPAGEAETERLEA